MKIFYHEMTDLVEEGRAMEIVYLDFSEVFSTVSYKFLIEELRKYGLDECTTMWIENWINSWAHRMVIQYEELESSLTIQVIGRVLSQHIL